jgi:hypothetical protein
MQRRGAERPRANREDPAPTKRATTAVRSNDEIDSSGDLSGIDVPKSLVTTTMEEPIMTNNTLIGVDLAKSVFEIVVSQRPGKVKERHRLSRTQFLAFFVPRPQTQQGVLQSCLQAAQSRILACTTSSATPTP